MKLKFYTLLFAVCLLSAGNVSGQSAFPGYDDWEASVDALVAAVGISGVDQPEMSGQDSIAAVDVADPFSFLGKGGADASGMGIVAIPTIDPPSGGAGNQFFHLIYFDGSEGMYHYVLDDNTGEPAEFLWEASTQTGNETFVNGFETNSGNFTEVMPVMPGLPTFMEVLAFLPVELTSFTGDAVKDGIRLNWATASELDNDFFTLQRANDAGEFITVAEVAGAEDAEYGATYEYIDESPVTGANYYRLIQTDLDGTVNDLNAIVVVQYKGAIQAEVAVYPNPTSSNLNVKLGQGWGDAPVRAALYDAAGRQVVQWTISAGSVSTESIAGYPVGIYQLRLQNADQTVSTRVVIE
ncbi:T9SS type A sorting domain-containing protein [Lewinella sp. 4G2]|uniref:T9SS type A sorting domain-containing protein n=1 Tax=Lewinella sp. 4G2 TaxID=1803372 RepID=UPI0007B4626B|nr:T9SS type A sorting domain-containing protein [Lewinella sp. 4G2]OAV45406.1 hypothetical protein A3850_013285 [Lewinella sp. 4G2]